MVSGGFRGAGSASIRDIIRPAYAARTCGGADGVRCWRPHLRIRRPRFESCSNSDRRTALDRITLSISAVGGIAGLHQDHLRRSVPDYTQTGEVLVLRHERKPVCLRVFPDDRIGSAPQFDRRDVQGTGKQICHKLYEAWRQVLVEEQPQRTVILSGMLAKNS